jgi:hypothetical protein
MSEEEVKALLRQNIELTQENNRMLHSIKRMTFWGGVFKYVWWIFFVIVLPLLVYYWYLQPYVEQALKTYQDFQGGVSQAKGYQASLSTNNPLTDLKKLYEQYQASHPGN